MANVKITELTALTNPASSDVLPIVDVGADTTKKVTIADLLENAGSGTASAAAFAFDGDADTGMYRTGANALGFTTGGTGRLFIDSSGNIGIGTSSPDELLHIEGDTAEFKGTNTNPISDTAGTEQVFKFGVEGQKNSVYGPAGSIIFRQDGSTWSSVAANQKPTRIEFCTQDSSASDVSETPRLVIDRDGNVGIGTTNPLHQLSVKSGNRLFNVHNDGQNNYTTVSATSTSDSLVFLRLVGDRLHFGRAVDGSDEKMVIDASGNMGIGTSSPVEKLHVSGTGETILVTPVPNATDQDSAYLIAGTTNYTGASTNFNTHGFQHRIKSNSSGVYRTTIDSHSGELFSLTAAGNTGIGTTSPERNLHVFKGESGGAASNADSSLVLENSSNTYLQFLTPSSSESGILFGDNDNNVGAITYLHSNNSLNFTVNASLAMTVDSSGNLLVGTTNTSPAVNNVSGAKISATGSCQFSQENNTVMSLNRRGTAPTGTVVNISTDGTTVGSISVSASATTYNTTSDYRLKENIVDIVDGITRVKQLQPRRFNFIADADKTVDGFIAHEAQTVVPEAVTGEKDAEEMQGIDQSKLVPLLTAALQEAIAKIETLEQRLTDAGL